MSEARTLEAADVALVLALLVLATGLGGFGLYTAGGAIPASIALGRVTPALALGLLALALAATFGLLGRWLAITIRSPDPAPLETVPVEAEFPDGAPNPEAFGLPAGEPDYVPPNPEDPVGEPP